MFTRWMLRNTGWNMNYWLLLVAVVVTHNQKQLLLTHGEELSGTDLRNSDYEYLYDSEWPKLTRTLGSVSAVALDPEGHVVVLHRGSHIWNVDSFDQQNRYLQVASGPIADSPLLKFHNKTGSLLDEWGANCFYMPHGLTIDKNNNYWITDTAMHQMFKFDLSVSRDKPVLTLGRRFEPGNDMHSFCKPTSVAVLENGDFFVADGYCNGRVMKFSAHGELILSWGKNSFFLTRTFTLPPGPVPENFFAIPHSLTYAADKNLVCVADREQGRVQCFNANDGTFHSMYSNPAIGRRLFAVKYIPLDGGLLYVINGPLVQYNAVTEPVNGFVLSMTTGELLSRFYPNTTSHAFEHPHEIAVSEDGSEIYVAELLPTKAHKFKRKRSSTEITRSPVVPHSQTFPPNEPAVAETLYASGLTIVSVVVSVMGVSCLILCVSRTICFKTTSRRLRFSTHSENIALHSMRAPADEEQGMTG